MAALDIPRNRSNPQVIVYSNIHVVITLSLMVPFAPLVYLVDLSLVFISSVHSAIKTSFWICIRNERRFNLQFFTRKISSHNFIHLKNFVRNSNHLVFGVLFFYRLKKIPGNLVKKLWFLCPKHHWNFFHSKYLFLFLFISTKYRENSIIFNWKMSRQGICFFENVDGLFFSWNYHFLIV